MSSPVIGWGGALTLINNTNVQLQQLSRRGKPEEIIDKALEMKAEVDRLVMWLQVDILVREASARQAPITTRVARAAFQKDFLPPIAHAASDRPQSEDERSRDENEFIDAGKAIIEHIEFQAEKKQIARRMVEEIQAERRLHAETAAFGDNL